MGCIQSASTTKRMVAQQRQASTLPQRQPPPNRNRRIAQAHDSFDSKSSVPRRNPLVTRQLEAAAAAATAKPRPPASRGEDSHRRLEDDYIITPTPIGRGGFGLVYRGVHRRTGRAVAIKKLERDKCLRGNLRQEVAILRRVGQHPNIAEFLDMYESPDGWSLVMELANGGDLLDQLVLRGAMPEAVAAAVFKQIAQAIQYCHARGVIHRDIKAENILLCGGGGADGGWEAGTNLHQVKLIDFGLAHLCRDARGRPMPVESVTMTQMCGTVTYTAPEVLLGERPYTYKIDSWSAGVILYTMLAGYSPFDPFGDRAGDFDEDVDGGPLMEAVLTCDFNFNDPVWANVSAEARALVSALITLDVRARLSMAEVLRHPWLAQFAPGPPPGLPSRLLSPRATPVTRLAHPPMPPLRLPFTSPPPAAARRGGGGTGGESARVGGDEASGSRGAGAGAVGGSAVGSAFALRIGSTSPRRGGVDAVAPSPRPDFSPRIARHVPPGGGGSLASGGIFSPRGPSRFDPAHRAHHLVATPSSRQYRYQQQQQLAMTTTATSASLSQVGSPRAALGTPRVPRLKLEDAGAV